MERGRLPLQSKRVICRKGNSKETLELGSYAGLPKKPCTRVGTIDLSEEQIEATK